MRYTGIPASPGVAIGAVWLYRPAVPAVDDHPLRPEEIPAEIGQYQSVRSRVQADLEGLRDRFFLAGDTDKAQIFAAHLELLRDEAIEEEILDKIRDQSRNGPWAIQAVYEAYAASFEALKTPDLRERAADLRDVCRRLLRGWFGMPEHNLSRLPGPVVLVALDLAPSDAAALDREHVLAIVTERGGCTSHCAIIARSDGIPAVLGVAGITSVLCDGQRVVADGEDGVLLTHCSQEEELAFSEKRRRILVRQAEAKGYLPRESVTPDGVRIALELNLASADPSELAGAQHTDGVGLFRSEFLYLGRPDLPGEEEQVLAYQKVLLTYGRRPVILRTLDVGGDKPLDSMGLPKEDNPFLGTRALRLCLERSELFLTQLRAALRASVHGNLQIMFPMVSSLDDIRAAKGCVAQAMEQLDARGIPYRRDIPLGIMVEVPSIALLADLAAREVDFASIGTNDLIQYTTASDRGNPAVSRYYQPFHPAVFRLIGSVVRSFAALDKPVGVCGEMGGDPLPAAVLLGLGVRRFSMGFSSVAPMKKLICWLETARAAELAHRVCALSTAQEVEAYLSEQLSPLIHEPFER